MSQTTAEFVVVTGKPSHRDRAILEGKLGGTWSREHHGWLVPSFRRSQAERIAGCTVADTGLACKSCGGHITAAQHEEYGECVSCIRADSDAR